MDWIGPILAAVVAFFKALFGGSKKDPQLTEADNALKAKTEEVKVMEAPDRTKSDVVERMRERADG